MVPSKGPKLIVSPSLLREFLLDLSSEHLEKLPLEGYLRALVGLDVVRLPETRPLRV